MPDWCDKEGATNWVLLKCGRRQSKEILEGVKVSDLAKGLCEEQKEITRDLMPSHAFFCHLDFLYSLIPLSSYQHLVVRSWPREQECTSFTPPFAKIYAWFCEEDSKKYVFSYYQPNSKWSIQMIHINLQNSLIQFYMFSQKIKKTPFGSVALSCRGGECPGADVYEICWHEIFTDFFWIQIF